MLLDGTLLTSDGETILLQDDDGNLSHFMIDHKTGLCYESEKWVNINYSFLTH